MGEVLRQLSKRSISGVKLPGITARDTMFVGGVESALETRQFMIDCASRFTDPTALNARIKATADRLVAN